jgi:hypothetical protein
MRKIMTLYEVPKPIINNPYKEPVCHWRIEKGEPPVLGRRAKLLNKIVKISQEMQYESRVREKNGPT